MSRRLLLPFVLLAVGVSACREKHPTAPQAGVITLVGQGKVQVVIQQDTRVKGDSAVFVVSIVGNGVPVASYQGAVTFDVASMDVKAVETPTAVAGEFRIVNATELAQGSIRFAGFATEHFSTVEAFRIVGNFKPGHVITNLVGRLDVAGETTGSAIRTSSLLSSVAVHDLYTNMTVQR